MKPSILALAVMCPLSLWAGSGDPRPLDTWELAGSSLKFDVGTILSPAGEGGETIPTKPSVTLELYAGSYYKLSIVTEAAEGHSFPHFLPGPPFPSPLPSSKAAAGFGYYSLQSDTLRFDAHFLRLFAGGEDLEEIVEGSGDAGALEEYQLVLSLVNGLFLDLFNDLYAYRSGDRLVFLLPGHSAFAAAAGDAAQIAWELQRSGAPPAASSTAVEAAVLGDAVAGLTVEFARAISGRRAHYAWSEVADGEGRLGLTLSTLDRSGASGFYRARARGRSGEVVGQWHSIPLNEGRRQVLELTLGGGARVVSSERLDAAKAVALQGEPAAAGLAGNHPNPFNSSTRIVYRLGRDGPVRLEIYNTLGQRLRTLVDEVQTAGSYRVQWDARDQGGAALAAGVYLTRLVHPGGVETRPLLHLE